MRSIKALPLMLAAIVIAGAIPGFAQFGPLSKGKDKAAENEKKKEDRDAKNLRTYEKIRNYAMDKYASDAEFRDQVDQAYADVLRDHMQIAFEKNTHRGSKIYAVNEDRFRMNDPQELYDNLLVQSLVNRIGQSLVPKDSDRVFAFRLTADPTPAAQTLSTGTIYISTGMVSLLDNEAQLAYVLAHEMAHVQMDHWKQKVLVSEGVDAYNNDQSRKVERTTEALGIAGAFTGGIAKGVGGAIVGAFSGIATGVLAGELANRHAVVNWDVAQEDEADKAAMKAMLDAQYDVREVPKLYALLEGVVVKDSRAGLGFLGDKNRVGERKITAEKLIADAYKADIEAQLKGKGFNGDSFRYRNLMAELKRDNGILAYYSDMFGIARKNLQEAVAIRNDDAAAQYYLGKVLETVGRTPEDRKLAEQSFLAAAQYDNRERENFGAHLHSALMQIEDETAPNPQRLTAELDSYVTDYVRYEMEYSKSLVLPPNINTIAEYMRIYGAADWRPTLPAGAENIRVNENAVPRSPEAAVKAAPAAAKNPCPPAAVNAARAIAGGNTAAALASAGCAFAPAAGPKK